jgi:mannosyltransferase OCH1-like enzyme
MMDHRHEIHQTWKDASTLTADMQLSISEWKRLHPHWTHLFWDDEDCDLFMRTHHPDFYPTYSDLPRGVMKADLFRIAVLYTRGGMYADTDIIPNVTIDKSPLWAKAELIFASWEANQTNAFIVSKRCNNPLLLNVMNLIKERHDFCRYYGLYGLSRVGLMNPTILYTTGPGAVRDAIGRDPSVYYVPRVEYMPCDICTSNTYRCPVNTGRYFTHMKGRSWNSSFDSLGIGARCMVQNNKLFVMVLITVGLTLFLKKFTR